MNDIEKMKDPSIENTADINVDASAETSLSNKEMSNLQTEIIKTADTEYTTRMQSIDTKIGEINTELVQLKKNIAEYNAQKTTLTDDLKKQKEEKLTKEKTAIEEKKKEVEKMLIDMKLAQLDQTQSQKVAEAEAKMKKIDEELKTIKPQGFFARAREWTKEHKKPILIFSWIGIGIWALSRLFKRRDRETQSENGDTKETKKKGFWNTGLGKVLKVVGIGAIGFLWLRWLFGWKKPRERWGTGMTDSTQGQIDAYENLDSASLEKYQNLGNNINNFYGRIREKEISWGFMDQNKLWTFADVKDIKFKEGIDPQKMYAGLVPFCIDQDKGTVENMYSERWLNTYLFSKTFEQYKTEILAWPAEKLSKVLGPFLWTLDSFTGFLWKSTDMKQNVTDRLTFNPAERKKELDFFFRQYAKVLTYVWDKKQLLMKKIALKNVKAGQYDSKLRPSDPEEQNDLLSDAMNDDEFVKKYIYNDSNYINFMQWKLMNIDSVLQQEWLLDDKMSPELQMIVDGVDEENMELLNYDENKKTTTLDLIESDFQSDGKLDAASVNELNALSNNVLEDMGDTETDGFMQKNFDRATRLLNMDSDAKKLFLTESWLSTMIPWMREAVSKSHAEVVANPTKENIARFKKLIMEYLAFKKELQVAIYTFTTMRAENPDYVWNILTARWMITKNFANAIGDIFTWNVSWTTGIHLVTWLIVVGGTVQLVWLLTKQKWIYKVGKGMVRTWILPISWFKKGTELVFNRYAFTEAWWENKILRIENPAGSWITRYSSHAQDELKYAIMNGELTNEARIKRCTSALEIKKPNWFPLTRSELLKTYLKWATDNQVAVYIKHIDNKALRKMIASGTKTSLGFDYFHPWEADNYYKWPGLYNFSPNIEHLKKLEAIDNCMKNSSKANDFFGGLLKNVKDEEYFLKLHLISQDADVIKKIENLDINKANMKNIIKKMGKSVENLDDFVARIKKWESLADIEKTLLWNKYTKIISQADIVVENLTDIQKACKKNITKEIDLLKDQLKWAVGPEKIKIQSSIDELEDIVKNINNFPEEEAKALNKLIDTGMDVKHISKILSVDEPAELLKKIDKAADITEFEKELRLSQMDDFVEQLKNARKFDTFYSEIKPLATKLDDVVALIKSGKNLAKVLKTISRIPVVG